MNVRKLLKQQKSAVMPSDSVKRRIAADCGVNEDTVTNAGGAAVKTRRNVAISVCACCCAAVAAITCAVILLNPAAPSIMPDVIDSDFGTISSATEFYAYSAVSVGNMLDGTDLTDMASAFGLTDSYDAYSTISTEITDLQKKILDKYSVFATGMLGGGKITGSCTAADREGYEYKLNIGYNDGFGSSSETVLYFNKVEGTVKFDGDEEKYEIEGILVKDDVSFPVEGKYKTETDGDETENEIEFTAYTSLDKKSYIKMEYEYESEEGETESKLVISIYENDNLTEKAKIKGETGEDTSFEVDVERPDENENVKIQFNPFEENGEKIMQVDAWFGEYKHELIMQNKPWEQGGGFDFINRSDGNEQEEPDDDWDDWDDWDDKDDKDEPVIPSPEYPDDWDKDNEKDWEYENPYVPPYGSGF
ncbi:MAG: hypothetical protein ACI4QI_06675 [Candidatus Coproplasma sp.]